MTKKALKTIAELRAENELMKKEIDDYKVKMKGSDKTLNFYFERCKELEREWVDMRMKQLRTAMRSERGGQGKSPKHGEWLHEVGGRSPYKCSVCGGLAWYRDRSPEVVKSDFCPNCGADMRKELTEQEKFAEKVYTHLMENWSELKHGAWNVNGESEWLRKAIFSCIESEKENESEIKT